MPNYTMTPTCPGIVYTTSVKQVDGPPIPATDFDVSNTFFSLNLSDVNKINQTAKFQVIATLSNEDQTQNSNAYIVIKLNEMPVSKIPKVVTLVEF